MKKLLLMMICVITLCIYCAAQEDEVRRLIHEYSEMFAVPTKPSPEREERIKQLLDGLSELESDEAFPVYYKILNEKFDDPYYVSHIMKRFWVVDGRNVASYGHQEALDWARRVRKEKVNGQGFDRGWATDYLVVKGDGRDIDLMNNRMLRERLSMRAAGTNLINYFKNPHSDGVHWDGCAPSVTNTGPQALYVEKILRQFWENLEIEVHAYDHLNQPATFFRDESKIPAELLTMVVWFDEDGNPVTNVDLAKYGLTMPEIDLPQKVKDEILRRARLNVATASLPSVEGEAQLTTNHYPLTTTADTPPNRLWLYALIPLFLCAGAGLWFIRKKR